MTRGRAKTFTDNLNERLDEAELIRLQDAARLEKEYFNTLKRELNGAIKDYMMTNKISACKMAKLLCCSDARALRIISGEHGFTMATVAHIGAALGLKSHITFEDH
jgi:hypothetical protein